MGIALTVLDEGVHVVGPELNWNESRYIDFWDPVGRIGGWLRIGARPNAGYAEMSACAYLPDGRTAFAFSRAEIDGNGLAAGGQTWEIVEPWTTTRVGFAGTMSLLADAWALTDPKRAFSESPTDEVAIDLTCTTEGLGAVMGQDQDQHHLIFLPGQADFHYQHMTRVVGTIRVGDEVHQVDGRGGKDHSWGPRNWHAKIYLRWLTCCIDDDNGFMLTRAVGPTKQTRSGFVWVDREFRVVDTFEMVNTYAGAPHFETLRTEVTVHAGDIVINAVGTPRRALPARHRQADAEGNPALLRIVKQPTEWVLGDGRTATGHLEYHDLVVDGVPVGLDD
ncbi:MAG: hypothetical protein RLZZ623_3308 [Actinomycetota bacterium]